MEAHKVNNNKLLLLNGEGYSENSWSSSELLKRGREHRLKTTQLLRIPKQGGRCRCWWKEGSLKSTKTLFLNWDGLFKKWALFTDDFGILFAFLINMVNMCLILWFLCAWGKSSSFICSSLFILHFISLYYWNIIENLLIACS